MSKNPAVALTARVPASTTAWDRHPFFQYPLTRFATSAGEIDLPILYYDCSIAMGLYWVDYDKARALVTDPGLEVLRLRGNKALAGTAFYEYRKTAIAPYNESGLAIAVAPKGARVPRWPLLSLLRSVDKNPLGFHILDLPVTTEAACAAGKEAWGYPKFVTPIRFDAAGRGFEGVVSDPQDGSALMALRGRMGLALAGPLLDLVIYSRHQGQLLRTLVNTRGGARLALPGSMQLTVSPSSTHPMAQRLRQLGLDGARPFCVSRSDALQLRLNAGAALPEA